MVATLSRAGTNTYSVNDRRSYDAWGVVRAQQSGGDPKLRYCASLGHRQDDESGLVYMRARYYEPASGRFVSEDPARDGLNWFAYCGSDPLNKFDKSGRNAMASFMLGLFLGFFGSFVLDSLADGIDLSVKNMAKQCRFALASGVGGLACNYFFEYLAKTMPDLTIGQRGGAALLGGLASTALAYLAVRAGEVLFELFAMDVLQNYDGVDNVSWR